MENRWELTCRYVREKPRRRVLVIPAHVASGNTERCSGRVTEIVASARSEARWQARDAAPSVDFRGK